MGSADDIASFQVLVRRPVSVEGDTRIEQYKDSSIDFNTTCSCADLPGSEACPTAPGHSGFRLPINADLHNNVTPNLSHFCAVSGQPFRPPQLHLLHLYASNSQSHFMFGPVSKDRQGQAYPSGRRARGSMKGFGI